MIIRARTVVPMEGPPIENGAVALGGDRIAAVGGFEEIRSSHAGDVTDLGESILLPGLINAHCHLDYTALRGRITPKESFADWIRAINAEKATLTQQDYIDSIRAGFSEAVGFGTTTIVNLTAFPRLIGAILEPIRTWWFGELIDVRDPAHAGAIVEEAVEALKGAKHWGLAPHAPFTASERLYALCEDFAVRAEVPLTTHLAESREEMQMFRDGYGPAFDFLKEIGRSMEDCGKETPLSRFLRKRSLPSRWIVAHLNELDAADFDLLANAPKFPIAHCPRSHTFLGHKPFALDRLRALGFNICLGTDSLASNSDLSLFSEMREVIRKHPHITPRGVVEMATINGARALGQEDLLGVIRPGAAADLIALPDIGSGDAFEKIVAFEGTILWMMTNGHIAQPA
jgi:cytosine/adenosine deaminase-related metal-dependent hydrolase